MAKRLGKRNIKQIEFSYIEVPNEKERIEKITDILSEGVYTYLKEQGLLRKDPDRERKVKKLLEEAREICNPLEEDC